jgi:hypothetical protein
MIPRAEERPNTIFLKVAEGTLEEGRAAENNILPGMLLDITSAEDDVPRLPCAVVTHDAQGALCLIRIAGENRLGGGTGIESGDLDDDYDTDDLVPYRTLRKGDVFLGRVAHGGTWTQGVPLCSGANGLFEALGGGDIALVEVEENIDFNGTDDEGPDLIRLRVI